MARRHRLTALLLVTAFLATPLSVFAMLGHEACVTPRHQCDDVPTIVECCCHDASSGAPSTPAEQRIGVATPAAVPAPAPFSAVVECHAQPLITRLGTSSPRQCLLDLPTLFATLLI